MSVDEDTDFINGFSNGGAHPIYLYLSKPVQSVYKIRVPFFRFRAMQNFAAIVLQ